MGSAPALVAGWARPLGWGNQQSTLSVPLSKGHTAGLLVQRKTSAPVAAYVPRARPIPRILSEQFTLLGGSHGSSAERKENRSIFKK